MPGLWWSVEEMSNYSSVNMFEPCDEAVRDMLAAVNQLDDAGREERIRYIVAVLAEHAYLLGYAQAMRNREMDA